MYTPSPKQSSLERYQNLAAELHQSYSMTKLEMPKKDSKIKLSRNSVEIMTITHVKIGIKLFFKICSYNTLNSDNPLARAVRT